MIAPVMDRNPPARARARTSTVRSTPRPVRGPWLTFLCLNLLGYALFGKGWAHLGVPPVFIGEVVLFCGILAFCRLGCWRELLNIPTIWTVLLLQAWGAYRTLPYLSRYGSEALRDAVLWGYSAFAVLVLAFLMVQPLRLAALLNTYKRFAVCFLTCIPFIWFAARIYPRPVTVRLPWETVPLIAPKAGDLMVHAAGILAFWVAYLAGRVGFFWTTVLTGCAVLVGTFDRAGLLTFTTVFLVCLCLRPLNRCLWRVILIGICGLLLFAASNVHVPMPGRDREISFPQLVANLTSTVSSSSAGDLDGTKQWRLEWWRDIWQYTVRGKYCWDGKGFGINLADDDGYQVEEDASLRDPHNGHLTMLARAGLPGLLLWVLVQGSWACSLLGAYLRSQRAGDERWAGVFLFLGAYWLAFVINAAFDVFLEGPMGGIWFWTVYGVGLGAVWIYQHDPAVLNWLACADGPVAAAHPARGRTMLEGLARWGA